MKAIVIYASKYGSTKGIAEYIADKFRQVGMQAEARHVGDIRNPGEYDAFVIGSAIYMMHWLKEATEFVTRNHALLINRPVWLFSSGPLGTRTTDDQGQDLRSVAEPNEIAKFRDLIKPRDHRVFFGVLDSSKLGFGHRMLRILPAALELLPEGDFRDWKDIETWAMSIARALETPQATPGSN